MIEQLSGASRIYPIIGKPVTYVQSPVWLTQTFGERGHHGLCIPLEVSEDDFQAAMIGLTATQNVDGILVTMPHKFAAFDVCATSTERARLLGVVSVIRRNLDGSWHGDMLDGLAFVKAQQDHGARIPGARALLIGAGGAGSAIAVAILEAGIGELVIHDAEQCRVQTLLELLPASHKTRVTAGLADPTAFDLVFNATPMGMEAGDPLPIDPQLLTADMFVGDVISGHGITPLIAAAHAAGCATAGGDHMVEAVQNLMADFLLGS